MVRVKFLLFALLVLGLWLGHLPLLSPSLTEKALDQAARDDWTVVSMRNDWATVF